MTTYLVSDYTDRNAEHGAIAAPYWRVTGMFNAITLAKGWVGSSTKSIITEHDDDAEAFAIYRGRVLPDDFAGRRIAA